MRGKQAAGSRRRTKIVCTIGPASDTSAMIEELTKVGMDCSRLNFSHGQPEAHLRVIRQVRRASRKTGRLVAVMQDLPGPKLRVGKLPGGSRVLRKGSRVVLAQEGAGRDGAVPVRLGGLYGRLKRGQMIFLSDGSIVLRVVRNGALEAECVCEAGGVLLSGKGVNIPNLDEGLEAFTDKDREYLAFGLENGVDLVAVSFVRKAEDVRRVKEFISKRGLDTPVVAKIEKRDAVENISSIADVADIVMVARGDLGVENPIEEVPEIQKSVIATCRAKGVPVITATQMLESMVSNTSPTRAEVTDVANAVLDGTDAVMLSEETAVGEHPIGCVQVMERIALKAEERMLRERGADAPRGFAPSTLADAFSASAWRLSADVGAGAIVVGLGDEAMIPKVSRFRPSAAILHVSDSEGLLRRTKVVWGVEQALLRDKNPSPTLESSLETIRERALLKDGEPAVFLKGGEELSVSTLVLQRRSGNRRRA